MQPGSYKAVVTDHRWTTAQSGNPGLAVTVDVIDGFGGVESMVGTIWFTPKSMGIARTQLRALGFDPDKQHVKDIGESISLRDHECEVQIAEEDYKGRTSLRIRMFGGLPKPPTAAQLSALDAALAAAKKSGVWDGDDAAAFERANPMVPSDESLSGNLPPPPPTPAPTEDSLPF